MPVTTTPRLARAAVATLGGVAIAAATLTPVGTAYPALYAVAADPCPTAKPVSELARGQVVTSLTVSEGTVPDELTGEVVGVLDDGIAPGLDMIIVKMAGSRVTDVNGDVDAGIWAGMSGSPVYADAADGRLIGSVSYGLSWSPSDYAGVTPAPRMYDVLAGPSGPGARSVDVPARIEADLRSDGVKTAARERFKRLPMPVSVSGGLGQRRLDRIAERAGVERSFKAHGGRAGLAEGADEIVAGGNLAASLSYGDITAAGVGTATAVCGNEVVGFGHPMLWSGPSDLTMHGADALFIQRDNVFGSFKVANPSGPVGAILQDRLAAISGTLGASPLATSVSSSMTSSEGNARTGTTMVSVGEYLPYLTAIHVLYNADVVYDGIRPGTGDIGWTIKVRREDGSITRIQRADLVASQYDLTFSMIWGIYSDLSKVVNNRFEDVTVTDVDVDAKLKTKLLLGRIGKVEARRGGKWVVVDRDERITARPGATIPLRVHVVPTADSDSRPDTVRVDAVIPNKGRGTRGHLHLSGGGESFGKNKASSFNELVNSIEAQAPSNSVGGFFHFTGGGGGGRTTIDAAETDSTVSGNATINVRVRR